MDDNGEFDFEMVQALIAEAQETIRSVRDHFRAREPSIDEVPAVPQEENVVEVNDAREDSPVAEVVAAARSTSPVTVACDSSSGSSDHVTVSGPPVAQVAEVIDLQNDCAASNPHIPAPFVHLMNESQDDDVLIVSETHNPNPILIDLCSPNDYHPAPAIAASSTNRRKRQHPQSNQSNDVQVVSEVHAPPPQKTSPPKSSVPPCVICLEDMMNRRPYSTICGHIFCYKCIEMSIKMNRKCPVCRKGLTVKNIHPIFMF